MTIPIDDSMVYPDFDGGLRLWIACPAGAAGEPLRRILFQRLWKRRMNTNAGSEREAVAAFKEMGNGRFDFQGDG